MSRFFKFLMILFIFNALFSIVMTLLVYIPTPTQTHLLSSYTDVSIIWTYGLADFDYSGSFFSILTPSLMLNHWYNHFSTLAFIPFLVKFFEFFDFSFFPNYYCFLEPTNFFNLFGTLFRCFLEYFSIWTLALPFFFIKDLFVDIFGGQNI